MRTGLWPTRPLRRKSSLRRDELAVFGGSADLNDCIHVMELPARLMIALWGWESLSLGGNGAVTSDIMRLYTLLRKGP